MRIQTIHTRNFIGARAVDIDVTTPVCLVAGGNGAGKSSIRDAVALALTGDLRRISLKKDAAQLISTGADAAVIEVTDSDGDTFGVAITQSKLSSKLGRREPDPVLPFVLDAQTFARLDGKARRAFLYDLMGVKTEPKDLQARLSARLFAGSKPTEAQAAQVQRIVPLLRAGFDSAKEEADRQATAARGAWKATTGEAYGSEKAKTWAAKVPPYDAAAAQRIATELQHCEVALEQWQRSAGALQNEERTRQAKRARVAELQPVAALVQRRTEKLATDEQNLADVAAQLTAAAEAAGETPRVGLVHDLARAAHQLVADYFDDTNDTPSVVATRAALAAYVTAHGPLADAGTQGDPAVAARLPELRQAHEMCTRAVTNARRDLSLSTEARAEIERITAELDEVFDAAALAEANTQIADLKTKQQALRTQADEQSSIKALVDSAEQKTKAAAEHHAAVVGWEALGAALAPDGIPGDILGEALAPMNARLAQSAADSTWPAVVIAGDMGITAGGRPYHLLSESEQWRTDAMIAEAVSHLSSTSLLVLDRADVLEPAARGELFAWLDTLAVEGEIATALVFMTLKAPPADLPDTIAVQWIEAGCVGQMAEAA